jgi:CDP-diacylglycerol---glycerol-3-phosphate 3-phosphatidyltransferase
MAVVSGKGSDARDANQPANPEASQGTPRLEGEQGQPSPARSGITLADLLTLLRLPLALLFLLLTDPLERLLVLAVAAATDLLDGAIARRIGSSRFGAFIDPVADKLFMLAAFIVVALSRRLTWYEIAGVLLRDLVATIAFVVTLVSGRPTSIPARLGGKAVTVAQLLTLVAFLTDSGLLRPLAWATAAVALYAIWDYNAAAPRAKRPVG